MVEEIPSVGEVILVDDKRQITDNTYIYIGWMFQYLNLSPDYS